MGVTSGFYNSNNGDRKYNADNMTGYLSLFFTDGYIAADDNALKVIADSGMTIKVKSGGAIYEGRYIKNDDNYSLPVDTADSTLNRIDRIICKFDITNRTGSIYVLKGTPASTAVAPELTRDNNTYELCIAEITVDAGTSAITDDMITDKRSDNNVCGISTLRSGNATTSIDGLMSSSDKLKLDGLSNYTLPNASETVLGGVKADGITTIVNEDGTISVIGGGSGITEKEVFACCADGTTEISNWAYTSSGNWYLPKIAIPDSLLKTGNYFCYYASNTFDVIGGENVTEFGDNCLHKFGGKSVSFPLLEQVGFYFGANSQITTVNLPSITSISYLFLQNCAIESLTVGGSKTLTLTASSQNDYSAWKLPVADMVAFGTALKSTSTAVTIKFNATYWNALSTTQKAIYTNKGYTITTD